MLESPEAILARLSVVAYHSVLPPDAYRDVSALVLGAGGFIGRWVARSLSSLGADLHMAARDAPALTRVARGYGLHGQSHLVDLAEPGAARELCARLRPAIVFNLAGYGVDPSERDQALAERLNRDLPGEVAHAMLGCAGGQWSGKSVVHAGTALEYGPVDGPIQESTPSTPTTQYGITKLAGASHIQTACGSGLRAIEGRIFTAYGPGEHPGRLLPSLFRARESDAPIALTAGLQERDFVYVREVAETLLRLGLSERAGFDVVNIATGRLSSVREFVDAAARVLGIDVSRLRFGELPYRQEEMWHGPVSTSALREQIGWVPDLDVMEGIREAAEFVDHAPGQA